MPTIDEKRVYSDTRGATSVYVASGQGLVVASVAGDLVGEFAIACRCTARDVAAAGDRLAVATEEDVLVGDDFDETGFGPAVAVGIHDGAVLGADEAGRVGRFDGDDWATLGDAGEVRAIDGPLVAAADGVHRVAGDDLSHAGLDDVRDVAGAGVPLAATGAGLYTLGNGWMDAFDDACRVVDARGDSGGVGGGVGDGAVGDSSDAHAVLDDGRVRAREGGEWRDVDLPAADPVVGFAYGPDVAVAVTRGGDLLVSEIGGDGGGSAGGWRSRALGVTDVGGVAIP